MTSLPYDPSFFEGRPVLVTGATGFLGGWLVRRLLDHGARVVAPIRRPRPDSQFELSGLDKRCTVAAGDVSDPAFIKALFDEHPFEAVFHTAANSDVAYVLREPERSIAEAVSATLTIVEQVRTSRPTCSVVVCSSDKAYGPQPVPFREDANLAPRHPYEVAKACQDLIARSYGQVYGLPITVTRCANLFGGFDFNWPRIIPGTARSLVLGEPVVLRSDGRFTRDFLYVEDGVDVQLMLAQRATSEPDLRGEAFNFSHEVDMEIIDIIHRLMAIAQVESDLKVANTAQAEIRFMRVASDKAAARLNWQPRFGFEAGLVETFRWYREHLLNGAANRTGAGGGRPETYVSA